MASLQLIVCRFLLCMRTGKRTKIKPKENKRTVLPQQFFIATPDNAQKLRDLAEYVWLQIMSNAWVKSLQCQGHLQFEMASLLSTRLNSVYTICANPPLESDGATVMTHWCNLGHAPSQSCACWISKCGRSSHLSTAEVSELGYPKRRPGAFQEGIGWLTGL